jgi:hypothetical protein
MKPGFSGALPTAIAALAISTFGALRPLSSWVTPRPLAAEEEGGPVKPPCDCRCECEFTAHLTLPVWGWAAAAAATLIAFACGLLIGRCFPRAQAADNGRAPTSGSSPVAAARFAGGRGQLTYTQ